MFSQSPPKDRHEFKPLLVEIEERPLNPLGRLIFWVVIAALAFTCLWMFLGRIDVVVTARGKVIPKGEAKVIQPLNIGMIHSILIRQGDHVKKGQVLIEIDPSNVDPELVSLRSDFNQTRLEMERIDALLEDHPFLPDHGACGVEAVRVQQSLYVSEKEQFRLQVDVKRESLSQMDERLAAEQAALSNAGYQAGILSAKLGRLRQVRDIISRDEYDQTESDLTRYTAELETSRHHIAEINSLKAQTVQEMTYLKEQFRNTLLTALAEKKQHALYLRAQIEKAEFISTRQQIASPVDGYISKLFVHTPGGVVTPAEKLAQITPSNCPLQIKALLQNKDAGFVTEDMAVSIKVDTFDFQKYGRLDGKIVTISKDSMEDDTLGLVYEILISPQKTDLLVDGAPVSISAGMGVTAEIKVGRRRIIEFFIYPMIKYLDEGMSVK